MRLWCVYEFDFTMVLRLWLSDCYETSVFCRKIWWMYESTNFCTWSSVFCCDNCTLWSISRLQRSLSLSPPLSLYTHTHNHLETGNYFKTTHRMPPCGHLMEDTVGISWRILCGRWVHQGSKKAIFLQSVLSLLWRKCITSDACQLLGDLCDCYTAGLPAWKDLYL